MKKFKHYLKSISTGTPVLIQRGIHYAFKNKKNIKENKIPDFKTAFHNVEHSQEHPSPYQKSGQEDYGQESVGKIHQKIMNNGKSLKTLANKLRKHYDFNGANKNEIANPIGARHIKNIMHYTAMNTNDLNPKLHQDHLNGTNSFKNSDEHHGIDRALHHHNLPHDLHVMSGVRFDPGEEMKKSGSNKLFLPAYTSASIEAKKALKYAGGYPGSFGDGTVDQWNRHKGITNDNYKQNAHKIDRHAIMFNLKKGHPGAYVEHISDSPGDNEFVIPRRSTIHMDPQPIEHKMEDGSTWKIWNATHVETESLHDMGVPTLTPQQQARENEKDKIEYDKKLEKRAQSIKLERQSITHDPDTNHATMKMYHDKNTTTISKHTKDSIANLKDGESHNFQNYKIDKEPFYPVGDTKNPNPYDDIENNNHEIIDYKATKIGDHTLLASKKPSEKIFSSNIKTIHNDHFTHKRQGKYIDKDSPSSSRKTEW